MGPNNRTTLILLGLFIASLLVTAITHIRSPQIATSFSSDKLGIGLLRIEGPITMSNPKALIQPSGAEAIMEELSQFEKDARVKALIIRVNSPGGTVGSAQELYEAVHTFKERKDIPVVVSIGDVGASGAYWISLAADRIYANPGSMIGSIGVILSNYDFSDVKDRYGIGMRTIKSGDYKDILSPWRNMTDDEQQLLNGLVNDVHAQFVTLFKKERNLSEKKARYLANGQIYSGRQAFEHGLIDQLGGLQTAIDDLKDELDIDKDPLIIEKGAPNVDNLFNLLRFTGFFPSLPEGISHPTLH